MHITIILKSNYVDLRINFVDSGTEKVTADFLIAMEIRFKDEKHFKVRL